MNVASIDTNNHFVVAQAVLGTRKQRFIPRSIA
jgi:hypothetical protein